MHRFNSAAGIAPAMLVAVVGTFYAGPSRAWQFDTPPVSSPLSGAQATAVQSGTSFAALPGRGAIIATGSSQSTAPSKPSAPARIDAAPTTAKPTALVAPAPRPLAVLVADHAAARTTGSEHECLANAVYFESKGEPLQGQLSVAEVVVNRSRSGRFPGNVCAVVKQKGQFSFVRGGRLPSVPRSSAAWHKAVAIAHIALQDLADGSAPRALFFHAKRVKPSWRGLRRVASVGNHVFYR